MTKYPQLLVLLVCQIETLIHDKSKRSLQGGTSTTSAFEQNYNPECALLLVQFDWVATGGQEYVEAL